MTEKVKVVTLHNEDTHAQDQYALSPNPIGMGKYAKVYKAVNMKNPSQIFAVKVIRLLSQEVKKEYLKELKIIKALPDCPNLVKIHKQHLQSQNNLYIFQQFCESGTLLHFRAQRLNSLLTEDQIYDIFYQVTNGLITLLDAGIVHQDIKPTNILKRGTVYKLCDFGISQIQSEYKASDSRKGTILYMPPQKLKERSFMPNQKSDIFSMGVCIYQTIFRDHPYLKIRTTNPKEYLLNLQQGSLKTLPVLMKYLKSSSLRLQNFLNFLLKMLDLNKKTRASLNDLKQFIKTSDPFKYMTPSVNIEQKSVQRDSYAQNFLKLQQSVITYREQQFFEPVSQHNRIKQEQQKRLIQQKQRELQQKRRKQEQQKMQKKKNNILLRYFREKQYLVNLIGMMRRGIEYIRKSNFNSLNITGVKDNFVNVDLSDCMVSRYFKYIIYQFIEAVLKKIKQTYIQYLSQSEIDSLDKDKSLINSQFMLFMIDCNFKNKQALAVQIKNQNTLELWKEIAVLLKQQFMKINMLKSDKKQQLLSAFYCLLMPKLLQNFSKFTSIFSSIQINNQSEEEYLNDTTLQDGEILLQKLTEYQSMKNQQLVMAIDVEFDNANMQVPFEMQSESEPELIGEEEMI